MTFSESVWRQNFHAKAIRHPTGHPTIRDFRVEGESSQGKAKEVLLMHRPLQERHIHGNS